VPISAFPKPRGRKEGWKEKREIIVSASKYILNSHEV